MKFHDCIKKIFSLIKSVFFLVVFFAGATIFGSHAHLHAHPHSPEATGNSSASAHQLHPQTLIEISLNLQANREYSVMTEYFREHYPLLAESFPNLPREYEDDLKTLITKTPLIERIQGRENVVVLNISKDLPFAIGRFCGAEGLENVEGLSAFRSSFATDYGLEITSGPLTGLCSRAVIVLSPDNEILHAQQVGEITEEPDYEAAEKALSAAS